MSRVAASASFRIIRRTTKKNTTNAQTCPSRVFKSTTSPLEASTTTSTSSTTGATTTTRLVKRGPTTTTNGYGIPNWQEMIRMQSTATTTAALLPWIGNGAYLALVSGFCMTDMLNLRIALVGGYTGLVAFHSLHTKPLLIPLRWSAIFVLVNMVAVGMLAMDRYGAPLSSEEEALYQEHFAQQLTKGQFYQLLCLGQRRTNIPAGTQLTQEGQVCSKLYFIEHGQARVYHHGAFAAYIDQGGFVNDIAFQRGDKEGAYGTTYTEGDDCTLLVWDQHVLRDHLKTRPDMDRNTKYLLSEHLMKSLLKQREARRWNQQQQQKLEEATAEEVGESSSQSVLL
eukprot:scaffold6818_cov95-Cylindrotheca_fusiformis.AAC.3